MSDADTAEFRFTTERDAAAKIRDAAKADGRLLHALPYSRYEPDETTWWLSPDPANPAYSFGKIVVERPTIVDDGAKVVGLHIEKGVGPKAAPLFEETPRGRRLVMQRDWTWHAFQRAMLAGDIDAALISAEASSGGLPLVVEVVAALQPLPKLEEAEMRPVNSNEVERIRYRASEASLVLTNRETASHLVAFENRETARSIAQKIEAMKDLDWIWVEVLTGVPLRPVASDGLEAGDVWRRVCAPWSKWLR